MTDADLIAAATGVIRARRNGDYLIGDVGAAVLSATGNLYLGVSIDTACSMGFCAEANAIGAMVTAGESRIARVVAVWQGDGAGPRVIPPCGRCREFIHQIDRGNLDAMVVLGSGPVPLRSLPPHHDWFAA